MVIWLDLSALMGVDFSVLIGLAPFVLVFGGVVAASRLLSFFIKSSAGKVLKGLGYFGFFAGILLLASGLVVLLDGAWSVDVWVLLVVTGLGLVLKPLSKIPFSALFGLVAGLICAGLLYLYFPLPATVLGVSSMWIYLVVFLVPALIIFLLFKFVEDLTKLFGLILGSWPVLTVLGFLCVAEGILLLLNESLLSLFG
jgi:hypothetical protein